MMARRSDDHKKYTSCTVCWSEGLLAWLTWNRDLRRSEHTRTVRASCARDLFVAAAHCRMHEPVQRETSGHARACANGCTVIVVTVLVGIASHGLRSSTKDRSPAGGEQSRLSGDGFRMLVSTHAEAPCTGLPAILHFAPDICLCNHTRDRKTAHCLRN